MFEGRPSNTSGIRGQYGFTTFAEYDFVFMPYTYQLPSSLPASRQEERKRSGDTHSRCAMAAGIGSTSIFRLPSSQIYCRRQADRFLRRSPAAQSRSACFADCHRAHQAARRSRDMMEFVIAIFGITKSHDMKMRRPSFGVMHDGGFRGRRRHTGDDDRFWLGQLPTWSLGISRGRLR